MMEGRPRSDRYYLTAGALTLSLALCLNCRVPKPAPNRPTVPDGTSSGFNDSIYIFTADVWDPFVDRICFRFDWGDGDTSAWSGWTWSGKRSEASHSWHRGGSFTVRAQVKSSGGAVSEWTDGHQVNILVLSWTRTFGGADYDEGNSVQQTSDGGYIVTGYTTTNGASASDVWLIKTDASGNRLWDKTFGGTGTDGGSSVRLTSDGGYVIAGYTYSYGAGGGDVWLIKTDSLGSKTWDKTFGGADYDGCRSVQQTSDGGYIVAGTTKSYGAGGEAVWLIKTDSSGNKIWDRAFGGTSDDWGSSVQQTTDGGYIVTGSTTSYRAGRSDVWLIKTDASGNKTWDVTFGGERMDAGNSVKQTSDGGYIIAGSTRSYGGDGDLWLIKVGASGK